MGGAGQLGLGAGSGTGNNRVSFRAHRHPPGPSGTNGRCFAALWPLWPPRVSQTAPRVCINLRTTQLQALQTVKSTNLPTNTARIATVEDMGIVVSFLLRRGNSKSAFYLLAHLVLVVVVVVML